MGRFAAHLFSSSEASQPCHCSCISRKHLSYLIRVLGRLSTVGLEALSLGVAWQARKLEETKLVGPNAFYLLGSLLFIYLIRDYELTHLSHAFHASPAWASIFPNASLFVFHPRLLPFFCHSVSPLNTPKSLPCLPPVFLLIRPTLFPL